MEFKDAKYKFIQTWGTLGSSWGINRTMAQIHALLLISRKSLCAEEIMEELSISRGNANMNLRTLMDWGIVKKELIPGERKEFFHAGKDIWELARQIARERRKREVEPVLIALEDLKKVKTGNEEDVTEFVEVLGNIGDFTNKLDGILDKFIRSDEHWFYKKVMKLIK